MAARVAILLLLLSSPMALAQRDAPTASAAEMDQVQIDVFQRRMVADPTMMETIRSLQDDPAFQEILEDPEIAAALEAGNTTALMANPKVSALISHPKVRSLTEQLDR